MNIENLRDPNLWEYVGRRITTLGGHVGIFDLAVAWPIQAASVVGFAVLFTGIAELVRGES